MQRLNFNPGLPLTSFRTTRPMLTNLLIFQARQESSEFVVRENLWSYSKLLLGLR